MPKLKLKLPRRSDKRPWPPNDPPLDPPPPDPPPKKSRPFQSKAPKTKSEDNTLIDQTSKQVSRFFNCTTVDISANLWLPTRINQTLGSTILADNKRLLKSWANSQTLSPKQIRYWNRISSQAKLNFPPSTDQPEKIIYAKKIRIYPTKEQRKFFAKCFGTNRYFYNKTLQQIRDNWENQNYQINPVSMVKQVMVNDKNLTEDILWQKEIPYDTRRYAVKQAVDAFKSSIALRKKGIITKFKHKFKTKKDLTHSFQADKKALDVNLRLFKTRLKESLKVKRSTQSWLQKNLKKIEYDFWIKKEKSQFFLCLPMIRDEKLEKAKHDSVALDPGVRTFQTFYSPDGVVGKLGDETSLKLTRIAQRIDLLEKLRAKAKGKKARHMKSRCQGLRTKIQNLVTNLHWQSASYLVKTYQTIIIPPFESSKMVCRRLRRIKSQTVRSMLSLSHYKFRMRLIHLANSYRARKVIVYREDYTSKTCTICGWIHPSLGGAKKFNCRCCGNSIDRDVNGSRNIMLRYLSEVVGHRA